MVDIQTLVRQAEELFSSKSSGALFLSSHMGSHQLFWVKIFFIFAAYSPLQLSWNSDTVIPF